MTVSATRLRHRCILDWTAQGLPTALVMQLADLGDSHTLSDLRTWMPTYDVNAVTTLMRKAESC